MTLATLFLFCDLFNPEDPEIAAGRVRVGWWARQCKPVGKPVELSVLIRQTSSSTLGLV